MGKFEDGVNGTFTGKVGSVVAYNWRGIKVMRSLARPSTKPRSPKQLANQAKMKLMQKLLKLTTEFVRTGFSLEPATTRMSEFNLAMSYNIKNAIKGEFPDAEINFEKFMFAQGDLESPKGLTFQRKGDFLEITWDPKTLILQNQEDQLMWCLISSDSGDLVGEVFGERRTKGIISRNLEDIDRKRKYHCFAAFVAGDRKQVSDSGYYGLIEFESEILA